MFNDDGLGAAMGLAHAQDTAKSAADRIAELERRVFTLENIIYQVVTGDKHMDQFMNPAKVGGPRQ